MGGTGFGYIVLVVVPYLNVNKVNGGVVINK